MRKVSFFFVWILLTPSVLWSQDTLRVVKGQSEIIDMKTISQVAIGDGRVADVKVINRNKQLMLTGLRPGMTTLNVWHGKKKIDYLVRVLANDPRMIADDLNEILKGIPGIEVRVVGERVMLEGRVVNAVDYSKIETVKKIYPEILNFVEANHVDLDQMVRIKVTLVEMSRRGVMQLGFNWPDGVGTDANWSVAGDLVPGVGPFAGTIAFTGQLAAAIRFLEQKGSGRILSNPTLVTKNGKDATFHAGGRIPIPIISKLGQTNVQWESYGIMLDILPHVDQAQNFNLELRVEVSDLDYSKTVDTDNGSYPSISVRSTKSQVNLAKGESLVLAELIDRKEGKSVEMVPGLGKLPILGELFRSRSFDRQETEVYLIVTPGLVRPGSISSKEVQDKQLRYKHAEDEVEAEWIE